MLLHKYVIKYAICYYYVTTIFIHYLQFDIYYYD